MGTRTIIVDVPDDESGGGVGLYARVSFSDQRSDLDRWLSRLCEWAASTEMRVARTESEVASDRNVDVRYSAASNRNCDTKTLAAFASDKSVPVRYSAASNPNFHRRLAC